MSQWYEDGLSLLDSGFFDSAIHCFDEVLSAEPAVAEAWALRATALSGLERYEEAIECFDQACEIDPLDMQAWEGKAQCLTKLGRDEEAARCQAEALVVAEGVEDSTPSLRERVSTLYDMTNGLISNAVLRIAADEEEAWFAYGKGGGATRLTLPDGQFRTYTRDDGLTSNTVRCIAVGEEDVWLGTDRGLSSFERESGDWTAITSETVLEAGVINDLALDGDLLWLGTDSGLHVLEVASGRSVRCKEGTVPAQVDYLLADGHRIWCGANRENGGAWVFHKQEGLFRTLDVEPPVRGLQRYPLDTEMMTWVAREEGIAIVDRKTYAAEDLSLPGLLATGIAAGVQRLLVSTVRGLMIVDIQGSGTERNLAVTKTEVGQGKYVSAVSASETHEWIAIMGEGVLCLSYSP